MKNILIIDGNYLCHRAYHAFEGLTHNDVGTAVVFGFLKEVLQLQQQFYTQSVVFTFDSAISLRTKIAAGYKGSRRLREANMTPEELAGVAAFRQQVVQLRGNWLHALGFRNVFWADGYEADDIIATLCTTIQTTTPHEVIIVSADKDLWQLITPRVCCWNPHKKAITNLDTFRAEWGLEPTEWIHVKAIAGCSTDDIVGVEGVAEKSAAQYLRGELPTKYKRHAAIEANRDLWAYNLRLVTLPLKNTPTFILREDEVTPTSWREVTNQLGLRTLQDDYPTEKKKAPRQGFGL